MWFALCSAVRAALQVVDARAFVSFSPCVFCFAGVAGLLFCFLEASCGPATQFRVEAPCK